MSLSQVLAMAKTQPSTDEHILYIVPLILMNTVLLITLLGLCCKSRAKQIKKRIVRRPLRSTPVVTPVSAPIVTSITNQNPPLPMTRLPSCMKRQKSVSTMTINTEIGTDYMKNQKFVSMTILNTDVESDEEKTVKNQKAITDEYHVSPSTGGTCQTVTQNPESDN